MQPFDFNFIILPLVISIVTLVSAVLLIANRHEIKEKRINRAVEKFLKEKAKKREEFLKQREELNKLFNEKAINKETYGRLSMLLKMNEEKLEQATDLLSFVKNQSGPKIKMKYRQHDTL
jgi:predicted Holliday junction resolvase-like endonuclease